MKTLILSTILIFALFSCKTKKGTSESEKLGNSSWEVILLGPVAPKSTQTITIVDSSLKGKAACNGFGGKIDLNESNLLTISDIISTKMGCSDLAEENSFYQKLKNTTNYKLVKEELSFYNSENKLLIKFKKVD